MDGSSQGIANSDRCHSVGTSFEWATMQSITVGEREPITLQEAVRKLRITIDTKER